MTKTERSTWESISSSEGRGNSIFRFLQGECQSKGIDPSSENFVMLLEEIGCRGDLSKYVAWMLENCSDWKPETEEVDDSDSISFGDIKLPNWSDEESFKRTCRVYRRWVWEVLDRELPMQEMKEAAREFQDVVYHARRCGLMGPKQLRRGKGKLVFRFPRIGSGNFVVEFDKYLTEVDRVLEREDRKHSALRVIIDIDGDEVDVASRVITASGQKVNHYSRKSEDSLDMEERDLFTDNATGRQIMGVVMEDLELATEMLREEMEGPVLSRARKYYRNVNNLPSATKMARGGRERLGESVLGRACERIQASVEGVLDGLMGGLVVAGAPLGRKRE